MSPTALPVSLTLWPPGGLTPPTVPPTLPVVPSALSPMLFVTGLTVGEGLTGSRGADGLPGFEVAPLPGSATGPEPVGEGVGAPPPEGPLAPVPATAAAPGVPGAGAAATAAAARAASPA